jgi:hypothetical protein
MYICVARICGEEDNRVDPKVMSRGHSLAIECHYLLQYEIHIEINQDKLLQFDVLLLFIVSWDYTFKLHGELIANHVNVCWPQHSCSE